MALELLDLLKLLSHTTSSKPALKCGRGTLSYGRLYAEIARRADGFASNGLRANDRVSLRVSNRSDDVVNILALACHHVTVLLVDRNGTDVECRRAEGMFEATLRVDGPELERIGVPKVGEEIGRSLCLVTSGVSGRPKVVKVDWDALEGAAYRFSIRYGLSPRDVVLCTTPISHSFGFCVGIVGPLCRGATIAMIDGRMTAGGFAAAIQCHQASVVQSVPFYYGLLAAGSDAGLRSVRICISAGKAVSAALERKWTERHYPRLCNHYGATEVGQISVELNGVEQSVGQPIDGCEVDVKRSQATDIMAKEGDGEIWVRTVGKPSSYVGITAKEDPSRNGGWFRTGDIGRFDTGGRLLVTGRDVHRISVGGRKVDPREIEETIRLYPGVTDCAVIGHHSMGTGEDVYAYVQGDVSCGEDLLRFLRTHLSDFKLPRVVKRVEQIPRTVSGKVRYGLLEDTRES